MRFTPACTPRFTLHAFRFTPKLCYIFIYPRFPEEGLCSAESLRANPEYLSRSSFLRLKASDSRSTISADHHDATQVYERVGSRFANRGREK